jgi:hypothetical protein
MIRAFKVKEFIVRKCGNTIFVGSESLRVRVSSVCEERRQFISGQTKKQFLFEVRVLGLSQFLKKGGSLYLGKARNNVWQFKPHSNP